MATLHPRQNRVPKRKPIPLSAQPWTPEKFQAFAQEIDGLRNEILVKMGRDDLDYIKRLRKISQGSEIVGRGLIHFSIDPLTWGMGVFSLWIHKQLEAIEIGHSALHGCWDNLPGAEKFRSKNFKWDTPVEEESWKRGHNELHHFYTNIIGRDPDTHFGPLRMSSHTKWLPYHLLQTALFFVTAPFFPWVVNLHMTGLTDFSHPLSPEEYAEVMPDRSLISIVRATSQSAKKMLPYFFSNFVFWPSLAGPFWWKVLGGNLLADILRDTYTCATIYAGHFGDDLQYYPHSFRPQGRGEWYKAQVEAAHDFDVPYLMSLLCGALDYQIEHHLFPKLPPNRLREIQPKIKEICELYGVRYNRTSWGDTLKKTIARLMRMSIPHPA